MGGAGVCLGMGHMAHRDREVPDMVAWDRDVMRSLVEAYHWIPHIIPKRRSRQNKFPLLEMLSRQLTVGRTILRYKPDVVASLFGSYCQSAWFLRRPNIIFTDSEFQHFNHRIALLLLQAPWKETKAVSGDS